MINLSKFLKTTSIHELEMMPNKALQTVSKEYFDYNKAKEKAEKARQDAEEAAKKQQQQNGNRNTQVMNKEGNNTKSLPPPVDASYYDDDSAEDLQDVLEEMMEGD